MHKLSLLFCLLGLFTLACGNGCDGSGYSDPDDEPTFFTSPDGTQCTDATPCGNCDQDCRLHGNPFLSGGGSGGDDLPGTDGSGGTGGGDGLAGDGSGGGLSSGGDGPGIAGGAGGGGTGFAGEGCQLNSDCRGLCSTTGVCVGHGEGGYNGDSCLSALDCRGECGGEGICTGSGTDPGLGGYVGGGIGGSCGQSYPDDGSGGGFGGTDGTGDPSGTGGTSGGSTNPDGSGGTSGSGSPDGSGGTPTGTGGTGGTDGTSGGSPGTGGGGTTTPDGTGGGGTTPGPSECLDLDIRLQHAIPTIALLIDQSGSMRGEFGNGMNRWQAEYFSLMDPDIGIIKEIEHSFRIGMSLYSGVEGQVCPWLSDVRPELGNYDAINRVFAPAGPLSETPTGESIMGTLRQFDVHPDQGRKILLLSTDGEPDTCAVPNPQNGQPEAIAAAQAAYSQGVETIVLSVGDEVGEPHQEDMANAGVGFAVGGAQQAPFYNANDPAQLTAQMLSILDSARSCIFRVQGGIIDPGLLDQTAITLDGMALEFNAPDGWVYHQNVQTCQGAKQCIELQGQACDSIQDGQSHIIHGDFHCAYYDPQNPPIGSGGFSGPGGDSTGTGGSTGGTPGTDGSGGSTGGGDGTGTGDGSGGTSGGTDGSGGGTGGTDGSGGGGALPGGTGGYTGTNSGPCVYDPGSSDGSGGGGGGSSDGGGDGGGGTTNPAPTSCVPASGSCEYDGDCCSGFCSGAISGICVVQ